MLEFIALSPRFELFANLLLFAGLVVFSRASLALIRYFERTLSILSRRRLLSMALLMLTAFVLSMALSLAGRLPQPITHDEFSYLLSADTFAHGRLTNPTHPMWRHFESFHIIQQPSYAAKYPPIQGLMLALGQIIAHPIVGVWISTALACAAVYWMLLAWVPPWLALLGGFITVLHPALLLIWGQIYWGGQVAVIGGALVFGALRRIIRRPRSRDGFIMGLGLALLASRRPYEGFVAVLPSGILLLSWMFSRKAPQLKVSFLRVVFPILLILVPTALWTGYYNWRVTGSPVQFPYTVYESEYGLGRFFIWQHPHPLSTYRHQAMRDFYQGELEVYLSQESFSGLIAENRHKLESLWVFYDGIRPFRFALVLPLLALAWITKNRWTRFAMATLALFVLGLLALTWGGAHFAPPIAGIAIILSLQGARSLRLWRWRKVPIGRFLVWSLIFVAVLSFLAYFAAALVDKFNDRDPSWHFARAKLNEELGRQGRHLIIVRYGPNHDPYQEWVYNNADIDASDVVWGREMNPVEDKKLIEYFKDRKVWLLDVGNDEWPPKLLPYPVNPN
jgi:hypothetical protein